MFCFLVILLYCVGIFGFAGGCLYLIIKMAKSINDVVQQRYYNRYINDE